MSNVHRISDFENQGNRRNNAQGMPLLGGNANSQGDPRKESFPSFLKNFCCPLFTFKSFIFAITLIDITMYIISISFGITNSEDYLLAPKGSTLDKLGQLDRIKIRQGQIWRWITYAFLHADFVHLVSNVITRLIIGTLIEKVLGIYRVIGLYAVTA
jgi:membrane associated rhomboid family serine protease